MARAASRRGPCAIHSPRIRLKDANAGFCPMPAGCAVAALTFALRLVPACQSMRVTESECQRMIPTGKVPSDCFCSEQCCISKYGAYAAWFDLNLANYGVNGLQWRLGTN